MSGKPLLTNVPQILVLTCVIRRLKGWRHLLYHPNPMLLLSVHTSASARLQLSTHLPNLLPATVSYRRTLHRTVFLYL